MPASGAIGSLRLADIGGAIYRYRGVALFAVGVIVASALLPGPASRPSERSAAATSDIQTASSSAEPAPPAEPVLVDAPVALDDQPARFSTYDPSVRLSETQASDRRGSSSTSDSTVALPPRPTSDAPTKSPLRVVASGWSTSTAGTPLAADGVPPNSLPVGLRLGTEDKLSFVRLAGDEPVLRLRLAAAAGQRAPETAAIAACPITTDWQPATEMSFSADPDYDCTIAARGARQPDGSWVFDLSAFDDRTGKGFALVPQVGDNALADWQVAFTARD